MTRLRTAARCTALVLVLLACPFAGSAYAQETEQTPPFVTTPEEVVERMLRLAGTTSDDVVVDLGSGDGRIVIAAARTFGARGFGVDIDPELVARSRENARRAGVESRVRFEVKDVLETDLAGASVVTIYLLPWLVDRLQPKLLAELAPGTRIVAHAFPMKGWKPDRRERLLVQRPGEGQSGESELFLWVVPAQARGRWRAADWELRVEQNYQEVRVEAILDGRPLDVLEAGLAGRILSFSGPGYAFRGRVDGGVLRGELERAAGSTTVVLTQP